MKTFVATTVDDQLHVVFADGVDAARVILAEALSEMETPVEIRNIGEAGAVANTNDDDVRPDENGVWIRLDFDAVAPVFFDGDGP